MESGTSKAGQYREIQRRREIVSCVIQYALKLDEHQPRPPYLERQTKGKRPSHWPGQCTNALQSHLNRVGCMTSPREWSSKQVVRLVKPNVEPRHLVQQTVVAIEAHVMHQEPNNCDDWCLPKWWCRGFHWKNFPQQRRCQNGSWQHPCPIDHNHFRSSPTNVRRCCCGRWTTIRCALYTVALGKLEVIKDDKGCTHRGPSSEYHAVRAKAVNRNRVPIIRHGDQRLQQER